MKSGESVIREPFKKDSVVLLVKLFFIRSCV